MHPTPGPFTRQQPVPGLIHEVEYSKRSEFSEAATAWTAAGAVGPLKCSIDNVQEPPARINLIHAAAYVVIFLLLVDVGSILQAGRVILTRWQSIAVGVYSESFRPA